METTSLISTAYCGTREEEIINQMDDAYNNIAVKQDEWYKESDFHCVQGCGECCKNFEPDLLESEAIYMAAWLIQNQSEIADKVCEGNFPFPREKGCQFWNENAEYHCSIYGGRPAICRLFGACGSKKKNGETVFTPCKFYPIEKLSSWKVPLSHREYSEEECKEIFGMLPPAMSNLMEPVASINMQSMETKLIRDCLPETIRRLKWISSMNK